MNSPAFLMGLSSNNAKCNIDCKKFQWDRGQILGATHPASNDSGWTCRWLVVPCNLAP